MERFDVIVVGGGSAGAALAAQLSDNPDRSVLLLEAGPDFARAEDFPLEIRQANSAAALAPGSPFGWPFVTQWTAESRGPLPRGHLVGGGSSVNGAYFVRGLAADFDRWAANGSAEWSYEKVLPFFRKSESDREYGNDSAVHGSTGPITVTRGKRGRLSAISDRFFQAGLDHGLIEDRDKNGRSTGDGVGLLPVNIVDGVRINSAMAYLSPRRDRANLTVRGDVFVERVLLDGRRAIGVEAIIDGQRTAIHGDEVVLSAGAAKSPHILMLSGIGPADELRAQGIQVVQDLPGVGKDFSDHTEVLIGYKSTVKPPRGRNNMPLIEAVLHHSASGSEFVSDIEIMPMTVPLLHATMAKSAGVSSVKAAAKLASHPLGTWRALRGASATSLARTSQSMGLNAFIVSVLAPFSRGAMQLTSADPMVFPRTEHRLYTEPEDGRRMREAIRLTVDLMRSPAFAPNVEEISPQVVEALASDRDLDRWMIRNPAPSGHLMGTCRMGPASTAGTVVDQYCRVHGIEGLRVVDLSILPTPLGRGPNATAMMLGGRAAALIESETK